MSEDSIRYDRKKAIKNLELVAMQICPHDWTEVYQLNAKTTQFISARKIYTCRVCGKKDEFRND